MSIFKKLLHREAATTSRFDRYYAGVIGKGGAGYPTADEARRDLRRYQRTMNSGGWMW